MIDPPKLISGRWQVFSAAPHRLLFFLGAFQLILIMAWWSLELAARATGWSPAPLRLPAAWLHAFLMIYGVFPFFIFGFLFTVYPRWLREAPIPRNHYVTVFLLFGAGLLLWYPGLVVAAPLLELAGALLLAGWGMALFSLYRVFLRARQTGLHERLLNLALAAGGLGMAAFLVAVLSGSVSLFLAARETGVWLFLVPVVFLVAHRMIPFFSQSVLMNYLVVQPAWGPPLMLVCVLAHVGLELAGLPQWRFLADGPLAVAALQHSWLWQFRRSFHARLLAMLHIAFLWLGIAMTLYTLQSVLLLATGHDLLGRAPLHALGIGFFASMIVAMGSRVLLGHSGRSLLADTRTWLALLGINLSAVVRIAAELFPAQSALLNLLAGVIWLAALLPWVIYYLPMTVQPRVDRLPG